MTPEGEETGAAEPTLSGALRKENLNAAWSKVQANGGAAGVDGLDIAATKEHIGEHWDTIEAKLLSGTYRPAAVREVKIPKPGGGERALGIPAVQDRLIQQAVHQELSPVWEPHFSDASHGFRPGRCQRGAVLAGKGYVEEGKSWVVDIDLKGFFDQIDHDILMGLVSRRVHDKMLLRLIGGYLRAPVQHADGSRSRRGKGTPQGGPLSPLLANIYLDPLDRELERRGLSFVRYADDIAIFVSSGRSAQRVLESVAAWIEKHLKVPVNRDKSGCGPSGGSSLLGFRIYEDGRIGVSPKAVGRMKERVREIWDAQRSLTSEELRDRWRRYIVGWWNYFELADWRREVEDLSGWIRRHMRKCFWLRWHDRHGRRNALERLGVKGRSLGNASSARGAWAMSRHFVMNQALNNKRLERHGFVIPWISAGAQR